MGSTLTNQLLARGASKVRIVDDLTRLKHRQTFASI
jgi:hypothetical protein